MFYYQQTISSPCRPCTEDDFERLTHEGWVKDIIEQVRAADRAGDKEKANALKRKLPMFLFMAGDIKETTNSKGVTDTWRKQEAVKLNGMFMLDVDDLDDPKKTLAEVEERTERKLPQLCDYLGIVLVHVTPKGHGLRFVAQADPEGGNLSNNQHWLANYLGLKVDEACKDSSRGSFCPTADDILFIDKQQLFSYNNEEYDQKFGDAYRSGDSRGAAARSNGRAAARGVSDGTDGDAVASVEQETSAAAGADSVDLERNDDGEYTFKGIPFKEIIEEYWKQDGGRPSLGERHPRVLALANRLRYITDNRPESLLRVIDTCGLPGKEVKDIVDAACAYKMAPFMPPRMRKVLESVGVASTQTKGGTSDGDNAHATLRRNYEDWWDQMRPLLTDGALKDATDPLPPLNRLGGVMAAGCMLGTYLTRCWFRHYDGKERRLSFLVYIIGDAASGKGDFVDMDKLIMEPMKVADHAGREWERQYKEDKAQRATSSQAQKKAAQQIQHPVIRYVPSTISNAKLYARLTDAKELINGEEVHLHLYTFEAELATALRVQTGSWAGKLDLECKSFQNEDAGVDYANEQSVNGIIQVNWNQVITGTPDAMNRKIKPLTVLDGLVTRLALFVMPTNRYQMISRERRVANHDAETRLRSWGYKLEKLHGEIQCEKLVDAAWDWCNNIATEAGERDDEITDYFRKRVPMYIVRYGIVYNVLRDYDYLLKQQEAGKPLKLRLKQQDLDFALLMGEIILSMQIRQYGEMVRQALINQSKDFVPIIRNTKNYEEFNRLPNTFTLKQAQELTGKAYNAASQWLSRYVERGLLKRVKQGSYEKLIKGS